MFVTKIRIQCSFYVIFGIYNGDNNEINLY